MFGVYDLLVEQGRFRPEKTALLFEDKRYSYRELNERINCVAYALQQRGIRKGSRVGMLLQNSPDFVMIFYALLKLGAVVSPFNYRYGVNELEQLYQVVESEFFITSKQFLDLAYQMVDKREKGNISITMITTDCDSCLPALNSELDNGMENWYYAEPLAADDVIFNIFTGGTTGLPKAASHTQYSTMMRMFSWVLDQEGCNAEDVCLSYTPMFHIGGVGPMIRALSQGATFCLMEKFDVDKIVELIPKERVTHMALIPPAILVTFRDIQKEKELDLSSLRILALAGGACDEAVLDLAFELLPDIRCLSALGSSENAILLSNVFNKSDFEANREIYRTLGRSQPLYEIKLVDENGEEVDAGQPGEAYGRSPAMMSGYWGQDNVFTEDGWFPTGDMLCRDEAGNYYFCGRSKDMIKCGGENIYANEVENALVLHPAVQSCAVVGLPASKWGEIVAAGVVLKAGQSVTEEELIAHCKTKIASYKKPRQIFFLDQLPVTGVGKVDKPALKQVLLSETNAH